MLYERNVIDTVSVSDSVEWLKKRGIEGIIQEFKEARKRRDYYHAISLACSYFQYIGKQLLDYELDKRVDLADIIKKLRSKKLVDDAVCDEMDKIRDLARNNLQHNGTAFEYSSKQIKLYEDLTVMALKCLQYFKRWNKQE